MKTIGIGLFLTVMTVGVFAQNGSSGFEIEGSRLKRYHGSEESVTIPQGIIELGAGAFQDTKIKSVSFPPGLISIGDYAFSGCEDLGSVSLPAGLISIGAQAFSGCGSLSSVSLPVSLISIGAQAFSGCDSLGSITLPVSLISIGGGAFFECGKLRSVSLHAYAPPALGGDLWDEDPPLIYVPDVVVDAYKTSASWSRYGDRIRGGAGP